MPSLSNNPRPPRRPTFRVECLEDRCVFSATVFPLSGTQVYTVPAGAGALVGSPVAYEFSGPLLTVPTADTIDRTATVYFDDDVLTVGVFQPKANGLMTAVATTRAVDVPAVYTGEVRLTALADAADVKRYGFRLETNLVSAAADGADFSQLTYRAYATGIGGSSTTSPPPVVIVPPAMPAPPAVEPPPPPGNGGPFGPDLPPAGGNGGPLGPAAPPVDLPPPPPPPPPRNDGPALIGQSPFEAGAARISATVSANRTRGEGPTAAETVGRAATGQPAGLTYQFVRAPGAGKDFLTGSFPSGVSLEAEGAKRISTALAQSPPRVEPHAVPELHGVALADAVPPEVAGPVADVLTAMAQGPIPVAPFPAAAAEPEPVENRSARKESNRPSYLFLAALLGVGTNHYFRRRNATEKV